MQVGVGGGGRSAPRPASHAGLLGASANATYFLWGGPPGPQAHPLVGFLVPRRMAGQGARLRVRGPAPQSWLCAVVEK
jgi:hypothetical protein